MLKVKNTFLIFLFLGLQAVDCQTATTSARKVLLNGKSMQLGKQWRKLRQSMKAVDEDVSSSRASMLRPRRLQEKQLDDASLVAAPATAMNLVAQPASNRTLVIAEQVVSWVGTVFAWFLFLSPSKTFYRIIKERSVSGFDSTPYLVSALNCILWVSYGIVTPNRFALLVNNAVGFAISSTWSTIFTIFSPPKLRKTVLLKIFGVLATWAALFLADLFAVPKIPLKPFPGMSLQTEILGIACVILNTLMYGAPLVVVRQVLKTKSVEFMPLPLSVMTFLTSCLWFAYSILVRDPWLFTPNVMGVALGAAQLIIYGYVASLPKQTKKR